jgi:hypothetical protein
MSSKAHTLESWSPAGVIGGWLHHEGANFITDKFMAEWTSRRWGLEGGSRSLGYIFEGHILSLVPSTHSLSPGCHKLSSLLCHMCSLPCYPKAMELADRELKCLKLWARTNLSSLHCFSQTLCYSDGQLTITPIKLRSTVSPPLEATILLSAFMSLTGV